MILAFNQVFRIQQPHRERNEIAEQKQETAVRAKTAEANHNKRQPLVTNVCSVRALQQRRVCPATALTGW